DGPKGTYPIGPVTGKPLFAYFAESILRAGRKYGHPITWYIMTSLLNCDATTEFFRKNSYFGLAPEQVFFFTQGTMPAVGYDGKLLLGARDSLALSPDGHGGTLLALRKSGALERMEKENTDIISYFQVDNPLVKMCDPRFIGLHALENSDMSAIMLAKTGPFEKLGNFCVSGGRLHIIEYSDLPEALAEKRNPDGSLAFVAGSPAIHMISRRFVAELTANGVLKLPWHRADKKIPTIDAQGNPVTPDAPNGVKLESFIFDALPLASRTMILEGDRKEVFAPTKNATGVDSAESCRRMLIERDARRLENAGVVIPRRADGAVDAEIEISPAAVLDDADAREYVAAHRLTRIEAGSRIALN
ncbi:MAG: UTP--glucose-1-phosphate uridylyltransferase, partial [Lentisphaeria bacterium]|nr:UTP--glucose-1-phosphate uridylyltransferase [Lentisphaeria bacterium]